MRKLHGRTVLLVSMLLGASTSSFCADMQRILLPINVRETPGAFGTIWYSQFFARNNRFERLYITPQTGSDNGLIRGITVEPSVLKRAPGETPGEIVELRCDADVDANFELTLRDNSHLESGGTELPVVRERDLLSSRLTLVGVPLDSQFRTTLRIYEVAMRQVGRVRLRLKSVGVLPEDVLLDTIVDVRASSDADFDPGYAEIQMDRYVSPGRLLDVEIEPLVEDMRFWAFVSSTNLRTQAVRLITPQ